MIGALGSELPVSGQQRFRISAEFIPIVTPAPQQTALAPFYNRDEKAILHEVYLC